MLRKLVILVVIARELYARYISVSKTILIDKQFPEGTSKSAETFYLNIGFYPIQMTNCSIAVENKTTALGISVTEEIQFSPMVAVNQTVSPAIKLTGDNKAEIFLDHYIDENGDHTEFESAVFLNTETLTTRVELNLLPQMMKLTASPSNVPKIAPDTLHMQPGSWPLKILIDKRISSVVEIGYETPLENIYRIYFKLSHFNRTTSNLFKKATIFEFNSKDKTKDQVIEMLSSVFLLPFPIISDYDRQYLLYLKNTNTVYLISSQGDVGYNNQITIEKKTLKYPINKMMYMKGEILFVEKHEEVKRSDGSTVNTYMNYFVNHRFGDRFSLKKLDELKQMYVGVILDSYYTIDKNHLLYDLLCPDLDGGKEDTLITTLYFSVGSLIFESFSENIRLKDYRHVHVPRTYYRLSTSIYTIEIFLLKEDQEMGINSSTLTLTNRITGESLGSFKLDSSSRVTMAKYVHVSNTIFLKTSNETFILKLKEADALIKITITKTDQYSEDAYRANDDSFFKQVTSLKCFDTLSSSWTSPFEMEFKGIDFGWTQNYNYRGQKAEVNYTLARGQTLEFIKKNFCLESFSEVKVMGNQALLSHENLFMDPIQLQIDLPPGNISQLVFFQFKGGRKKRTTLIFDQELLTAYYQLKGLKFEWKANGFDSRHISDIWMMNTRYAFVNISKNLYAFDTITLQERPLTILGSYCLVAKKFSIANLPFLLACFTEDKLIVSYLADRFSSNPAVIHIQQTGLVKLLKNHRIMHVMYSPFAPNILVLLVAHKQKQSTMSFLLLDFQTKNSINVFIRNIFPVRELPKDETIQACHLVENYLLLITNSSTIYQYVIREISSTSRKRIHFLRKYALNDFFKESIRVKVNASYSVTLREDGSNTYKRETRIVQRLVFKVVVQESKEKGEVDYHENAVIMNPHLHSTSSFNWLFQPYQCKRLPIGPAFFDLDRKYLESVIFACSKDSGTAKEKKVEIYLLKQYISKFWISEGNNLADVLMGRVHASNRINSAQFNITCERTLVLDKYRKLHPNPLTSKPLLPYTININYIKPYRDVQAKMPRQSINIERKSENSFLGLLLYSQKTTREHSAESLFYGHLIDTWITCDSQLECNQKVIELFDKPRLADVASFKVNKQDANLHFSIIETPEFRYVGIIGSDIKYAKIRVANHSIEGQSVISLDSMLRSCSVAESYRDYILSVCAYPKDKYVLRVFDIKQKFSWYDVNLDLHAFKAINVGHCSIEIHRHYLAILTYNPKYGIYLSGYLFKMVKETNGLLRLVYLGETSMNDEEVHFKVYLSKKAQVKVLDKVYVWSATRANASHYLIRVNGYAVVEKEGSFIIQHVCQHRVFPVGFNFTGDLNNDYLLNQGKILPLKKNDENSPYIDIILNLPFADDFLFRFDQASLENQNKTDADILLEMKVLRLSNPFFGIKIDEPLDPVFTDKNYFVAKNDFSQTSVILCYLVNEDIRSRTAPILGRFLGLAPLESPGLPPISSVFTYSVLNFGHPITGLQQSVYIESSLYAPDDPEDESALVHVLFSNGSVKSLDTSHKVKFRINSNFAASDKLVLHGRGPSRVQSIDVLLLDENEVSSIQAGVLHLIIIASLSFLILCSTRIYLRRQPRTGQQQEEYTEIGGDKSSEVEAAAKTTADDKSPD